MTHLLHQGIGDGHTRELGATSMRPLFTMSSQSRDLAKVKVESLDEPVDCISRFVGKDLDQVISSEFTG